jgi:hypothetical protein
MSVSVPLVSIATALRRVCGAAALLAVFAMHGLAVHGAMHAGHGADPMPTAVAVAGDHTDHDPGAATMADSLGDSPAATSQEDSPGPELLGYAGLCLAILLASVVALALRGRFIRLRRRRDSLTVRGWPSRSRRDRDPPCLFALSIQRC